MLWRWAVQLTLSLLIYLMVSCAVSSRCVGVDPSCAPDIVLALFRRNPGASYLYVANQTSGDVYFYNVDASSGKLTFVRSYTGLVTPLGVSVDPLNRFLYVAAISGTGPIYQYSVDPFSGELTRLTPDLTQAFGSNLQKIVVDAQGKFAFAVTAAATNNVFAYSIPSSGLLASTGTYSAGSGPGYVSSDPSGKFVAVSNITSTNLSMFSKDSAGNLTAVPGSPFTTANAPGHAFISENRVYVPEGGAGNQIRLYNMDTSTGQLTFVSGYASGSGPIDVALDSSRRFAFSANGPGGNVSAYTVDAAGALTQVAGSPYTTAANANGVVVDASGNTLYALHTSGSIFVFSINQTTGQLTQIATTPAGSAPVAMGLLNRPTSWY